MTWWGTAGNTRCLFSWRDMENKYYKEIITEDIREIEKYINVTWKNFTTVKEVKLNLLFAEPENTGLRHIWKYGSADLVVYRNNKPICIIESGGGQHFQEKQNLNDRRKWKLAEQNNVRCLTMINGLMHGVSKRKWRALLGRYLFGCK